MDKFISWLEAHDKLSGWAQFLGAMLALLLTYFTAFAPLWRRRRQLHRAALRLLSNGYEAIESYHRTSANFLPFPLSLRAAALTMTGVADEIDRFPVFELDDQGSRSVARYLIAMAIILKGLELFLEPIAAELEGREATAEDQVTIRTFVGERLDFVRAMMTGAELKRPEWPV
ncbi:hypothetical protein CLG96_06245 [Sphingomonas oleivorans]|uniref:Uncharacterized protein n=1 Tax=Sphingomonas oleivorans TaxID=1735121 RepID=A0A2T5FZM5_9SPHN|nr:hypothetical protein [Sphingomonas oleivorans]PTQ12156.1 hypothetical protein CLG96_06245 [Sphingomonas oleivorans]